MDTIFAPATAPGRSGIAVLRISGDAAAEVFAHFSLSPPTPRMAAMAAPVNPHTKEIVDHGLMLYFPAPASFTGEHVVEFHFHGSRAVMQEMLLLLGEMEGFRLAEPGEFARRAFFNQKIDLTQAEAIADLIDAETTAQKRQALRQMDGSLARRCEELRGAIIEVRAHLEAFLDFPDEDIPDSIAASLDEEIMGVASRITKLLGDGGTGEKIREGFHAAILGAPNAGKSTLLNLLARRDVAITSPEAGTTRDVLEVHLDLGGFPLTLADTAGLRETENAIEAEGIRRAEARGAMADFRLLVLDASMPLSEQRFLLSHQQQDDVVILNKTDLNTPYIDEFCVLPGLLPLSAKEESGIENLISLMKQRMEERLSAGQDALITRTRHRLAFERAQHHLTQACRTTALEIKGEELRLAGQELGKIVGTIHIEDVLDVVFSSFCIGK